jgi:hypothetical protein
MRIGEPKEIHEIEPIDTPVPESVPAPAPVPKEVPAPAPARSG